MFGSGAEVWEEDFFFAIFLRFHSVMFTWYMMASALALSQPRLYLGINGSQLDIFSLWNDLS